VRKLALGLAAIALTMSVGLSSATAQQGDDELERALALYSEGEKLYKAGQYRRALAAFNEAYDVKPAPGLLYNIGQCHRKLGNLEQAIAKMTEFLDLATDANPEQRRTARELVEEMTETLAARAEQDRDDKIVDKEPIEDTETRPVYKKWWFWATIGVVAAAGTAATIYFVSKDDGVPGSELGNVSLGVLRF
jgi:tetratricopeptide (TPR) repeat protein